MKIMGIIGLFLSLQTVSAIEPMSSKPAAISCRLAIRVLSSGTPLVRVIPPSGIELFAVPLTNGSHDPHYSKYSIMIAHPTTNVATSIAYIWSHTKPRLKGSGHSTRYLTYFGLNPSQAVEGFVNFERADEDSVYDLEIPIESDRQQMQLFEDLVREIYYGTPDRNSARIFSYLDRRFPMESAQSAIESLIEKNPTLTQVTDGPREIPVDGFWMRKDLSSERVTAIQTAFKKFREGWITDQMIKGDFGAFSERLFVAEGLQKAHPQKPEIHVRCHFYVVSLGEMHFVFVIPIEVR